MGILFVGVSGQVGPDIERTVAADAAAAQALQPRTFTLKADNRPLADVLKQLTQQTGMAVVDRRHRQDQRPLAWDFKHVLFWQAVDQIAAATQAGISLCQPEGGIALVDEPYRKLPVSYGGIFRTNFRRISLTHDLEAGSHSCNILLEVAWEPRFQPFYLDPKTIIVLYGPNKTGAVRQVQQKDKGQIPVTGRSTTEIDVQVPAPERSVTTIKALEGSFSVLVPTKMLRFTFDNLKAVPAAKTQEGVSATLREFLPEEDHWTAKMVLQYPKGGPRFESYQSWLGNNKIALEKIGGKERWPPSGERILKMTSSQAIIEYYFENSSGKDSAQWKLVYDTPGPIVEVTTAFSFKDLLLP